RAVAAAFPDIVDADGADSAQEAAPVSRVEELCQDLAPGLQARPVEVTDGRGLRPGRRRGQRGEGLVGPGEARGVHQQHITRLEGRAKPPRTDRWRPRPPDEG